MTPAELITRKLMEKFKAVATLPVESLLVEALEGDAHRAQNSGILVTVHVEAQKFEARREYEFSLSVRLAVAIDDDKSGHLFRENYEAIWSVLDYLADGDNCSEIGSKEDEDNAAGDFFVDGFLLGGGNEPDFAEDDNGGTWTTTFTATLTGRAY